MEIKTIKTFWETGQLKHNTHVIIGNKTCVVIDAGAPLEEVRKITDLPIEAVFITHGHFDHINYIEEYDELGVSIYASKYLKDFMFDEILNASGNKSYRAKNIVPIENGEVIETLVGDIKCFETPGHSEDSMCYLLNDEVLFSGDTVFSVEVGSIDLPTGDTIQLLASLDKILNLNFNEMFTGHGRKSTKEEQLSNIPRWINYFRNTKTI